MAENAKDILLNGLHFLLSHNILRESSYQHRYNGFVAELHFADWVKTAREKAPLTGGIFIPLNKTRDPFENSVYYTICSQSYETYAPIYEKISRLITNDLYFVNYSHSHIEHWSNLTLSFQSTSSSTVASLPCPPLSVFLYDRTTKTFNPAALDDFKSQFSYARKSLRQVSISNHMRQSTASRLRPYSLDSLTELYVNRLIFDGLTGFNIIRGAALDIDSFVCHPSKDLIRILEVKEKDISKTRPRGFGMDLRRIASLATLEQHLEMRSVYLVREITDQQKREFKNWKYVFMDVFREKTKDSVPINGGSGMGFSDKENPTIVCPEEHFKLLTVHQ